MSAAPTPEHESKRLEALRRYGILDTLPESGFDELTRLAAQITGASIAFISFVDEHRLWFKSRLGLKLLDIPRAHAFCAYTILQDDLFVVEDAGLDTRFAENPLLKSEPPVCFYAGMPLTCPDGYRLGALAVLDTKARLITHEHSEALKILARQVATQLELRRHIVSLARSVEEHKSIEAQLRTSEAFFHTLVESLPQNIFRKDVQGRFTFCNEKFCQIIGQRKEDILGKTDYDFFPPELAAKYHRDDLRVMNTLEHLETVEAHQTPTGEKLYVHVMKTPLRDALGWVVGIQGIFWDVTLRKKTEEALAYERDLLRGLLDNIPDRIYFKDVESRFLRCSTSMALRLGLDDPRKIVGKNDFDFHPKELAQEFYADEQRITLTGRPLINKLERQVDLEGREIWASVTKVPIYDQNGHITGIIGISRDITRLKQTEFALQQARDAALESARVKSQFLANMSHEIRTPMNAIVGMTGLLLDTRLSQEQKEFVQTIRDSTHTLLGIINDILDYSKVESGKFSFEIIDFDLREAIETTLEMLAETAAKKEVELSCWVEHNLPRMLQGDPGRLRQVLANLLSNAVKFMEKGEVLVRASRAEEAEDLVVVHFAVQDTGIGIDPKALELIFDAFTQADGSTTRKYGGTGLGLSISKQLVELMHGQIGVESIPGKGSTFWFKLPFPKGRPEPVSGTPGESTEVAPSPFTPSLHRSITPPLDDSISLGQEQVLVIADRQTQRENLLHLLQPLRPAQVEITSANTALETLDRAATKNNPFTLVLVDIAQGQTEDRLALVQSIKARPALAAARLVVLTSLGQRLSPAQMQQAGITACVGKPLRSSRFYECLRNVLLGGTALEENLFAPASFGGVPPHVRILLAEDNAVNQRLAMMQLKKLGYNADAVGNGTEVLEALTRIPYEIILMDCQMPELDGYEVTRRLRQAHGAERPAPYIIALTANALQGDRERCLAAGMNDYLHKPLHLPELGSALQRALLQVSQASRPSETTVAGRPTLDYGIINSLKGLREPSQPDPLRELIELFLRDGHAKLQKLETALTAKDESLAGSMAHSLKGSSSNLGARRLAAACASLEKRAKAGDLPQAANIFLEVKTEFLALEKLLLTELQK